ncbi:ubiquitin carboxyl-terminal hydrolase CYLD [Prorops nasuta]|uniref:ubiquitin carboxyl-terminal hydrolase CYLD n=1 Tax=Prorops nasuta TaxID=863751 RepID=UPI0034CD2413
MEKCAYNHGNHPQQFYIAKRKTILTKLSGSCSVNVNTLQLGTVVEALEEEKDSFIRVRVRDVESDLWSNSEWRCHRYDLLPIPSKLWEFLPAITIPQERVALMANKALCEELKCISLNDRVWYQPDTNSCVKHLAIVKYIGPVSELSTGFYFGLDLLDHEELSKVSLLTSEYFVSTHASGVFAPLNKIIPYKTEPAISKSFEKTLPIKNNLEDDFLDEKKNILQSMLLETYGSFDDSKNNNHSIACTSDAPTSSLIYHNELDISEKLKTQSNSHLGKALEKNENKRFGHCENYKNLSIDSVVKVCLGSDVHYGILRWIGTPAGMATGKLMAAVELDEVHPLGTDGTYNHVRYFQCRPYRAIFTDIEHCFQCDNKTTKIEHGSYNSVNNYESQEDSVITGIVRPICVKENLESICGKYRGIQGHHNSCYLDATLFSMFTFTSVFDTLLYRPPNEKDCPQYEEVQRVLREEIVNPLRKNMFVRSDRVMKLRTLLERLSSVSGLTSEEKDPEEFLTSLVAQILNAEPFLKLSSGQDAYHYQLFVEKDEQLNLPTVQQLLEQSFLTSNIRLKEVPSCLIIQMPRFGKSFKMYQKIQPTLLLDVTDLIEDSPRQCTVCGKLAEFECKECYGQCGMGLESIAFCLACLEKVHSHERRTNHEPKKLVVPMEFAILQEHCPVPRLYLELSAVVCIETSHYVCFVKCGSGSEALWCFFDSMADRKGEQNGYNIPEMVPCPDFPYWLSEEGGNYLTELTDDRHLPEHAKRLLCDAYMCMYQSPDVMMYK